jgi:23S rRNA (cytosine1962-C5)-methyltransferase
MRVDGEYSLLDAGDESKLERVGTRLVIRQAAQAYWPKAKPGKLWREPAATHIRSSSGGGYWKFHTPLPESWVVRHGRFNFNIKLTDFGHLGLFPEQEANWDWIAARKAHRVLNLFGYTGGSTLAAASAGAEVTHVDASRGAVAWARENFEINDCRGATVRWIVEDVNKYLAREETRGSRYHGVILDPPSFGRGPRGQVWKIETDLVPLLEQIKRLMPELDYILLSCHTPGYSPLALANILHLVFGFPVEQIESGEMVVAIEDSKMVLPSGTYARFAAS